MEQGIGILILSEPGSRDLETVRGISQAALEMGVAVELFFMGDGVYHMESPHLKDTIATGAAARFCTLNTRERQVDQKPQYPWGCREGSQYDLACLVERADKFLAFT